MAVRRFSNEQPLQERFVAALKRADGSLLLSSQNLAEFCMVEDLGTAQRGNFLDASLAQIYVADFTIDRGFAAVAGGPSGTDFPGEGWLLSRMLERAELSPTRQLSVYRFSDVITIETAFFLYS